LSSGQLELAQFHPIGDRRAGALVAADGSISWWTSHLLDSDAVSYALVHPSGGHISLRLHGLIEATATESPVGAPIVTSTLRSLDSLIRIEDHLADGIHGFARGTIVRLITALHGPAVVSADIVGGTRFQPPRRTYRGTDVVAWPTLDLGSSAVSVRGMHAYEPLILESGESRLVTISPVGDDERVRRDEYERRMVDLRRVWRRATESAYIGAYQQSMRTWLRQLLLLTNLDSGAVARSFSTSLPTSIGGDRQMDERMAFLDDNARFVRLCERLDRFDLVDPTRNWLADALLQGHQQARSISGAALGQESDLLLHGWRDHQPVHRSNRGAGGLDLAAYAQASLVLDGQRHRAAIRRSGDYMADFLTSPESSDGGRWSRVAIDQSPNRRSSELPPTPWVSSMLATRAALSAAAKTERKNNPLSLDATHWQESATALSNLLHTESCFGLNETAGWRRSITDDSSDAQLLRWITPADPAVPFPELPKDAEYEARIRTENSVNQMLAQLDDHGLLHRHLPHANDGFAPGQGADVSASADMVTALCRLGRWEEAHDRMEKICSLVNGPYDKVGTVPSHLDPRSGAHLGNRPHAPALLSLCEAALALSAGPI
jgi:hypothetical protein